MGSETRADILLVTVTKIETSAVLEAFGAAGRANPRNIAGRVYFDLGTANGALVMLTRSEMGAGGLGASLQAVGKGIAALSPAAVVMVGIAFGVSEEKQSVGDILVTQQLRPYELQRVGARKEGNLQIILRDDKPHASPWLLNILRSSEVTWEGAALQFGTVLTGEKLIDDLDFRDQLRAFEPEAIGGEMEGAGLYVACHDQKVDWILVKAICDFADGQKGKNKAERHELAAKNAATFVHHAIRFAPWTVAESIVTARPITLLPVGSPQLPDGRMELKTKKYRLSNPTVAQLLVAINGLTHEEWDDSYLILIDSAWDNAFIQICQEKSLLFVAEYRDGQTQRQYRATKQISIEAARFLFLTYLRQDYDSMKHAIEWEEITCKVTTLPGAKRRKSRVAPDT